MDLALFDSKVCILKNYPALNFNFTLCYESSVMRTRNNRKGKIEFQDTDFFSLGLPFLPLPKK